MGMDGCNKQMLVANPGWASVIVLPGDVCSPSEFIAKISRPLLPARTDLDWLYPQLPGMRGSSLLDTPHGDWRDMPQAANAQSRVLSHPIRDKAGKHIHMFSCSSKLHPSPLRGYGCECSKVPSPKERSSCSPLRCSFTGTIPGIRFRANCK